MTRYSRLILVAASASLLGGCRHTLSEPAAIQPLSAACQAALAPGPHRTPVDLAIGDLQQRARDALRKREALEQLGYQFVNRARLANDPGDYVLAERVGTCIDERSSGDLSALLLRGHALHQLHRFHEAEAIARTLVAKREFVLDYALLGDTLMQQEPIPGIAYENGLVQRFLPEITLADVNNLARNWIPDRNRVVAVMAPKKAGVAVPDEAKLAAIIKNAGGGTLTAYVDTVSAKPLLETEPKAGAVAKTATKAPGVTEWTLSNGVRVVLQPTTFKQDEILFRAFSPGGTSLASDQDYIAAETADQIVAEGGLGTLSAIDLSKKLAGKVAVVRPDISEMYEGMNGRALRRDLETMFQLIYLRFTQPRADAEAFRATTGQLTAALANRQAQPDAVFEDALNAALTQNHLRARPMSPEFVQQMNLDKSLKFYKERFADASDFTFVFVGSFDLQTIKPLVEKYLASLPALNRKEAGRDVGIRPPSGVVEKEVTKGNTPKSEVGVVFTGPFANNQRNRIIVRAMANTLGGNLQRVLREDLGGTYGVSVVPEFTKRPNEEYQVTITFACDPARTQDLVKALFRVVDDLKTNGPGVGQVADVQAALRRDLETDSRENGFVLNQLSYAYQYDESIPDPASLRAIYDQLSPAMLREAARTYLDANRYVKVLLFPEKQ